MRLHTLLLFVLALTIAPLAPRGDMPATLRGVVRDPAGGGLYGASVLVQRWGWDRSLRQARLISQPPMRTDDEGRFSVYLPPGLYDVFISYIAMEPVAKKIEIRSVTPTNLDCRLELSPLTPTVEVRSEISLPNVAQPLPSSFPGCVERRP